MSMREEEARECVSVFQWVFNTAWLLTLVYLFFDVSNTIIKDLFPNPLQEFYTSSRTFPLTNSSKLNLAIQIICRC